MSERSWLLRDATSRILADAPLPPATWLSVARRAFVLVACFAVGLALGDLHAGVIAAFGALQVALVEAALPLRSLIRLIGLLGLACIVAVFVALLLGGTWWAVIALTLLAYVFGATGALSPAAMTIGISGLAVGVIFAGMPAQTPALALQSTAYFAAGIAAQSLAWLAVWSTERRRFIRHALANKLRTDVRLLRGPAIDIAGLIKTHAQVDVANEAISAAKLGAADDRRARMVLSSAIELTRAIIAWMVLDAPSEAGRIALGVHLECQIRRLDSIRSPRAHGSRAFDGQATPAITSALAQLDAAISGLDDGGDSARAPLVSSAQPSNARAHVSARSIVHALWPGAISRHGLRMAIGVGSAEAIALAFPAAHSFWLPLTVVFTLRPDWTFTVIRGFTRTLGNLGAVIVLPALLMALGNHNVAVTLALAVLSSITFRYFYGNYAIASFGLAGTVLLLDSTLAPDGDLFVVRIVAAILGSLIALAVAFAMPTWSSADGPRQVRELADALARWRSALGERLAVDGVLEHAELDECNADARRALVRLDQTSTGALLEPRRDRRAIEYALVTAAGTHEVAALVAVSMVAMTAAPLSEHAVGDLVTRARLRETTAAFDSAVAALEQA